MRKFVSLAIIASMMISAPAMASEKSFPMTEDLRLTDDFDLNVASGDTLLLDGQDTFYVYEAGGILKNTGAGKVYLQNTIVYCEGQAPAAGTLAELSKKARDLDTIAAPAANAGKLALPSIPGYAVSIKSSSNTRVIALDGTITPPSASTSVSLTLTLSGGGGLADTKAIVVPVPARASTVAVAPYVPNGSSSSAPGVVVSTPAPGAASVLAIGPAIESHPASAATLRSISAALANELYKLGLFVGTGTDASGAPTFELTRPMTRIEALSAIIRLLGLEAAANAYPGANPFTDVPAWAARTAAYAYSMGITVGVNDAHTLLDASRNVTHQEFTAFLLRVLQYSEKNGDFAYANTLQAAASLGLYSSKELSAQRSLPEYLRSDAVVGMADALLAKLKGGETRLIEKLAADNVLKKEAANAFIGAANKLYKGD